MTEEIISNEMKEAELLYWAALICQLLINIEDKLKIIPLLCKDDKDLIQAFRIKNKFVKNYLR